MLLSARPWKALCSVPVVVALSGCGGGEVTPAGSSTGEAGASTGGSTQTGGAGGTTATTATAGGSGGGPVSTALVHRVGRFDESDPARPTASWSGTTFRTRVSGTSLSVSLGGASGVIFQIEVDGQPTGKLETAGGDQTYEVASGLAPGEHDVTLVRRNEGFFGDVAFLGFEPGPDASLVETPWPYAHSMELIGDSLTAGYGIEGADASCNFSAATEYFPGTYGAIAARNVGAAVHAIAYSGKGVFQNYGADKNTMMPELWYRTLTNDPAGIWDFTEFQAEAVVVNLGTNDFSAPIAQADFVGAYVDLLKEVRAAYPGAMIFCVTWAHWGAEKEGWVQDAMSASGDPDLRHVAFSIDPADGYGCDYHTNLVTNQKLGAVLTQALKDEVGW